MKRWQMALIALAMIVTVPLLGASALAAAGDGPVAAWSFNGQIRRLSRDVAADTHHALAHDEYASVEAPGLKALEFDGHDDFLTEPSDTAQVMSDR